jgi:ankyrin repeat protein
MAHTIDQLLNLMPDKPDQVLTLLTTSPHLASAQDHHGYSLLHAAASYNHPSVITTLLTTYSVSPNLVDEDNETCLFSAETPEMALHLLSSNVDPAHRNNDNQTAAQKFEQEAEYPDIVAALRRHAASTTSTATTVPAAAPPLPNGVKIDMGTMVEEEAGTAPDPEFRRRIDELASRPDFQSDETQRELRHLVQDALTGIKGDERHVRPRME